MLFCLNVCSDSIESSILTSGKFSLMLILYYLFSLYIKLYFGVRYRAICTELVLWEVILSLDVYQEYMYYYEISAQEG